MKAIDLLNKIANDEEVPERIKFYHNEFYYDKDNLKYRNIDTEKEDLFEHIDSFKGLVLNDEVEIIEDTPEEDKKINKLDITGLTYDQIIIQFTNKINEIIDKINKGE